MKRVLLLLALVATHAGAQSPAVRAVIELPRTEAVHHLDAALALVDLGEPELAKKAAEGFVALELDAYAQAKLVANAGAAKLLRLAREFPEAAERVTAILGAASAQASSPERLETIFKPLLEGEPDAARAALADVERTGAAGVAYALERLATADSPKHEARLREALVALYPDSLPALVAGLQDESLAVRTQSAYAWGRLAELDRLGARRGASLLPPALVVGPALLSPAGDPLGEAARWSYSKLTGEPADTSSGAALLRRVVDDLLVGTLPIPVDADGLVPWTAKRGAEPQRLTAREVGRAIAAPLAADLARLSPGDSAAERLALLLALESGAATGPDPATMATHDLLSALEASLDPERPLPRAAAACCRVLGERRDPSALLGQGGSPGPLPRALGATHDAVRFAALEAVLAIAPTSPFAGSSAVGETLAYFACAEGTRRAVVAAPQLARAADLVGWLTAAGFEAVPTNRGDQALRLAAASPDVELVLLDVDTLLPSSRETLFRLRRTPATAARPVGLLAAEGRLGAAERLAADHGGAATGVLATPRLLRAEDAQEFAERLARLGAAYRSDAEARRAHAAKACAWIERIEAEGPAFYRVGRGMLPRGIAAAAEHAAATDEAPKGPIDAPVDAADTPPAPAEEQVAPPAEIDLFEFSEQPATEG